MFPWAPDLLDVASALKGYTHGYNASGRTTGCRRPIRPVPESHGTIPAIASDISDEPDWKAADE